LSDYDETTLVSVFTIICSMVCRHHDHRAYSNISDFQCVFCSYDPQYAYAGCSWCRMLLLDVFVS